MPNFAGMASEMSTMRPKNALVVSDPTRTPGQHPARQQDIVKSFKRCCYKTVTYHQKLVTLIKEVVPNATNRTVVFVRTHAFTFVVRQVEGAFVGSVTKWFTRIVARTV